MISKFLFLIFICISSVLLPALEKAPESDTLHAAQEALGKDQATEALLALSAFTEDMSKNSLKNKNKYDLMQQERFAVAATLRAQAYLQQEQYENAEKSFELALEWKKNLIAAGEGLIFVLSTQEKWKQLQEIASTWALRTDSRPELLLIAIESARQNADPLMGLYLSQLAAARFPQDRRFRIALAQALTDAEQNIAAEKAWLQLSKAEPQDSNWWRAVASLRQKHGNEEGSRQAIHIAYLQDPDDIDVRREYFTSLLSSEYYPAAFNVAEKIMNSPSKQSADILLGVRAAWFVENYETAHNWLQMISETNRDSDWYHWSLQLAIHSENNQEALSAVNSLINQGQADSRIRLHAAQLSEQENNFIAAESHLRVVLRDNDPHLLYLARLQLARLLLQQQRHEEALRLAEKVLQNHPADAIALQLLYTTKRSISQSR